METKFTKGKWETNNDYVWSGIVQICDIYEIDKENKDIEAMSNAKLISAAPDMFNALLDLYEDKEVWQDLYASQQEFIVNVLNKATGSSFFKH